MNISKYTMRALRYIFPTNAELRGECQALRAEATAARQARDAYLQQLATMAANQTALTARMAELMAQIRAVDHRLAESDYAAAAAAPLPEPSPPSRRAAKFVVFSNPRSGSTWLETSLGLLSDVYVDYELKWGVSYVASDIHAVLGDASPTVWQLLENMDTDAVVTGSKFVFDTQSLTPIDFRRMIGRIGPDVRIIHLTRSYRDVFLSIRRGYYHAPSDTSRLSPRLDRALKSAHIGQRTDGSPQPIDPMICFRELARLLDNDLYILSLRAAGFPYLQVAYEEISDRFVEIARFAGSTASVTDIEVALTKPAVSKLPKVEGQSLVTNIEQIEPFFGIFDSLRETLLKAPDGS